jgi:acyl-CoA synthetase (AMP-forming)/AMP-acid ligase II
MEKREKADRLNSFYLLEEHAQNPKVKDCPFIIYQGRSWTFKQTYDIVLRYAGYLHSQHSVQQGEIIALDFMNSPQFLFLVMALWSLGALPALINYNLTSTAFVHSVRVSTARLLIVDPEVEPKALTPETRSILEAPNFRNDAFPLEIAVLTEGLQSSLEYYPPYRAPDTARSGNIQRTPCVLIFTSGTTGLPKAAKVPWDRTVRGAGLVGSWLPLNPVTSKNPDRYYTAMPLYHGSAFQLCFHTCLSRPTTFVIGRKFSVSNFWKEVAAAEATAIQYVGETLRYLLAAPAQPDDRTKHKVKIAFGNGLRPDVWDRFRDRFGVETIGEFYGATESSGATFNLSRNTFASGAIGSMGLVGQLFAAATQTIVEIDWETEEPRRDPVTGFCIKVPRGEVGELLVVIDPADIGARYQGYLGNDKATNSKLMRDVHKKGDAYFRTGDAIRFDKEGRYWFSDRIGDTFRWRSENVSTAEVAQVLGAHPSILEANVYGISIPNHDGRAGCAAVMLRDVVTPETPVSATVLESIATFARNGLPKYAVPVFLRVVTEVMATGNNKQQKHVLRKEGAEPAVVSNGDRIFYLPPTSDRFVPFGEAEWDEIKSGKVKL